MPGLIGVLDRTGRDLDPDLLEGLLGGLESGPDDRLSHLDGPFGIGFSACAITPEDAAHPQPAIDRDAGAWAFLDGRLDDRERLAGSLAGTSANRALGCSDAQLALAAYLSLGPGWAAQLLGDFALVIWNRRLGRVVCVRDASGIKPLYYAIGSDYFAFGSTLRSVLRYPAVSRGLNQGMLGEYLTFAFKNQQDTLYTGVRRLPPAHLISVDRRQASVTRYWDLDPHARIRYRDTREYAQHFRELFRRAVADRLRCIGPVGATLSGGIDSSAVVGMAQQLFNEHRSGARLRAYSMTFPGEGCDETPFIDAVVERWSLISTCVPWTDVDSASWARQAAQYLDLPDYPTDTRAPLFRAAAADGVRVLLTGEGGDYWHNGSTLPHRHMLATQDITNLISELRYEAGYTGYPHALRLLAASLLWGLIPGTLRRWIESRRQDGPLPPFLSPRFAREIGLATRRHTGDCAERFPDASQWQLVKFGRGGLLVHFYELLNRSAASYGLELRHPLLDRRLIEFAVAIPDHLRRRGRIDRYLMRHAMSDFYPAAVRARTDKATFGVVLTRALLTPQVQQILGAPVLLERPWIEPDRYRRFLDETLAQCRSGTVTGYRQQHFLWTLFAVELWYREAFGA